ncbi:hypothetical protein LINGRAPRIM_LOCUS561 [Linum grandiflorum]
MNRISATKTESSGSSRQAKRCRHGAQAHVLVSGTLKNPGRQFYKCPLWKEKNANCKYFQWADEDASMVESPGSSVRNDFRRSDEEPNRILRDCLCWVGMKDTKMDRAMKDLQDMKVELRSISEAQVTIVEEVKKMKSKTYISKNGVWFAPTVLAATLVLLVAFVLLSVKL